MRSPAYAPAGLRPLLLCPLLIGCARLRCPYTLMGIDEPATPDFLPQDAVARVENAEKKRAKTLNERLSDLQAADEREAHLMAMNDAKFPVVCFDAMLPGQVMELETADPGFSMLLCTLGLGGLFVMVSLNGKQRRVRRHGVVVRVALVDAVRSRDYLPTSVRARLVARERVVLCGPDKQCVARWRRQYDPDGEVSAMGWGYEPIVSGEAAGLPAEVLVLSDSSAGEGAEEGGGEEGGGADPPLCDVRLLRAEAEAPHVSDGEDGAAAGMSTVFDGGDAVALACARVLALMDEWEELVRDQATYDNVDVTAGARVQAGQPGLRRDPSKLLDGVVEALGERPDDSAPTRLALYAAALINPLPSLGVAPECRAATLEAKGPAARLAVVERALRRSVANLRGEGGF
jgi:hypothetical protein